MSKQQLWLALSSYPWNYSGGTAFHIWTCLQTTKTIQVTLTPHRTYFSSCTLNFKTTHFTEKKKNIKNWGKLLQMHQLSMFSTVEYLCSESEGGVCPLTCV